MKKMFSFTLILALIIVSICGQAETKVEEGKNPEAVYNAICEYFGQPSGQAGRNALVKMYGEGTAEDQILVIDSVGDSYNLFFLFLNRSDKPNEIVTWLVEPATEKDYKKLFEILHKYGEGYGISAVDRCLYLVGNAKFYVSCTNLQPDNKMIFDSVDKMIKQIISDYHKDLTQWMKTDLLSTK